MRLSLDRWQELIKVTTYRAVEEGKFQYQTASFIAWNILHYGHGMDITYKKFLDAYGLAAEEEKPPTPEEVQLEITAALAKAQKIVNMDKYRLSREEKT